MSDRTKLKLGIALGVIGAAFTAGYVASKNDTVRQKAREIVDNDNVKKVTDKVVTIYDTSVDKVKREVLKSKTKDVKSADIVLTEALDIASKAEELNASSNEEK